MSCFLPPKCYIKKGTKWFLGTSYHSKALFDYLIASSSFSVEEPLFITVPRPRASPFSAYFSYDSTNGSIYFIPSHASSSIEIMQITPIRPTSFYS